MKFSTTQLAYSDDTEHLLVKLQKLGNLVALESSDHQHENGKWSIISAAPAQLITIDSTTKFTQAFDELTRLEQILPQISSDLPFCGGLIGHISYDLGMTDTHSRPPLQMSGQPLLVCGLYTWAFIFNHDSKECLLAHWSSISTHSINELTQLYQDTIPGTIEFELSSEFKSHWDKSTYKQKIQQIHEYIRAGDTYQVNLTQSFSTTYSGNPLKAYTKLKEKACVPFASYFEYDRLCFASASPELFLQSNGHTITTKPIKGTRPVRSNPEDNQREIEALSSSTKDQAENLMIVDLLRNDLSKNAKNVTVTKLFDIETFNTVHHLVSTITAEIDHSSPLKILFDAFPGGSITGAPKKRSMEIISELEGEPRSFYCGTTFYLSCNNQLNSNILIRSFLFDQKTAEVKCWAGGGIVMDSKWEEEYQESLDKISKLMQAIN